MSLLASLCSLAAGLIVGLVLGYRLALSAATWGLRASVEAREGSNGLFGPQHGSPEVQMAEEREKWLVGATAVKPKGEDELDDE